MKTEKQKTINDFKNAYHCHEDTNLGKPLVILGALSVLLTIFKLQDLSNSLTGWSGYLFFLLSSVSLGTFFISNLILLLKGYGFAKKPGHYLYTEVGSHFSVSSRGQFFFYSKKASMFAKIGLLIWVIILAVITFVISMSAIYFNSSSFLL